MMGKKSKVKVQVKKRKGEFTPCSRCPDPKACTAAGQCLAEDING